MDDITWEIAQIRSDYKGYRINLYHDIFKRWQITILRIGSDNKEIYVGSSFASLREAKRIAQQTIDEMDLGMSI